MPGTNLVREEGADATFNGKQDSSPGEAAAAKCWWLSEEEEGGGGGGGKIEAVKMVVCG